MTTFRVTESGVLRIGLIDHSISLRRRVLEQVSRHTDREKNDECVEAIIADISKVIEEVSEENDIEPPHWAVRIEIVPGGVRIGFQDSGGNRRTVDDMERELKRLAVNLSMV